MSEIQYRFDLNVEQKKEEIVQVFTQTFTDSEGENEGQMVGGLAKELLTTTAADELRFFAATDNEKIIACILFTPLKFESGDIAYLLSPVATLTEYQKKGVMQQLIKLALQKLLEQGIGLVFTYGDPNFYSKVGFEQVTTEQFQAPYPLSFPNGWLAQSLSDKPLSAINGKSSCAAGLSNASYW